jgi:hypothetical protein
MLIAIPAVLEESRKPVATEEIPPPEKVMHTAAGR